MWKYQITDLLAMYEVILQTLVHTIMYFTPPISFSQNWWNIKNLLILLESKKSNLNDSNVQYQLEYSKTALIYCWHNKKYKNITCYEVFQWHVDQEVA